MALRLKTAPGAEPVTLADVKQHVRVDEVHDDAYLGALIKVARHRVESHLGRALISQTWQAWFDGLAAPMELLPDVSAIVSVKYQDADNAQQTLGAAAYELDQSYRVCRLRKAYGQTWPVVLNHPESVVVEFVAGFGAEAADVPDDIKHAMYMMIGQLYEYREEVVTGTSVAQIPMASEYLLAPYRVPVL